MTAGRIDTAAGSSATACPRPPALTASDLSRLRDDETDELIAGEMVGGLELAEAGLSGDDLSALTLLSCQFSGVFANDTDLAAARLVGCRLERLNAIYLRSPRSTWHTAELAGSRIGVRELYNADVEPLPIKDCRLGFTNLVGITVHDLLVRATRIDELDLSDIDAQRVRFEDCQVDTLCLHGGSLSDISLRGLEIRTVSGVDSLAGATINSGQLSKLASLLAQCLGLRVTDQGHVQNATTRSKRAWRC